MALEDLITSEASQSVTAFLEQFLSGVDSAKYMILLFAGGWFSVFMTSIKVLLPRSSLQYAWLTDGAHASDPGLQVAPWILSFMEATWQPSDAANESVNLFRDQLYWMSEQHLPHASDPALVLDLRRRMVDPCSPFIQGPQSLAQAAFQRSFEAFQKALEAIGAKHEQQGGLEVLVALHTLRHCRHCFDTISLEAQGQQLAPRPALSKLVQQTSRQMELCLFMLHNGSAMTRDQEVLVGNARSAPCDPQQTQCQAIEATDHDSNGTSSDCTPSPPRTTNALSIICYSIFALGRAYGTSVQQGYSEARAEAWECCFARVLEHALRSDSEARAFVMLIAALRPSQYSAELRAGLLQLCISNSHPHTGSSRSGSGRLSANDADVAGDPEWTRHIIGDDMPFEFECMPDAVPFESGGREAGMCGFLRDAAWAGATFVGPRPHSTTWARRCAFFKFSVWRGLDMLDPTCPPPVSTRSACAAQATSSSSSTAPSKGCSGIGPDPGPLDDQTKLDALAEHKCTAVHLALHDSAGARRDILPTRVDRSLAAAISTDSPRVCLNRGRRLMVLHRVAARRRRASARALHLAPPSQMPRPLQHAHARDHDAAV